MTSIGKGCYLYFLLIFIEASFDLDFFFTVRPPGSYPSASKWSFGYMQSLPYEVTYPLVRCSTVYMMLAML